ncbi:TIGR04540 family protein, partial [Lentibacillus lipolyticus]
QRDLGATINEIIDSYWQDDIDESEMIELIQSLCAMNKSKMLKNGEYTTIIKQKCGKKRLDVVNCVLDFNNKIPLSENQLLFMNE